MDKFDKLVEMLDNHISLVPFFDEDSNFDYFEATYQDGSKVSIYWNNESKQWEMGRDYYIDAATATGQYD